MEKAMKCKDKRECIIRAAEKLFRSRRFDRVTLDTVAEKAAVGKGTIYLYFKSKEDLFFQMATAGFDELEKELRVIVDADEEVRTKLVRFLTATSQFFSERLVLMQIMYVESEFVQKSAMRKHMKNIRSRLQALLHAILRQGMETGLMSGNHDLSLLECMLIGSMRFRNMVLQHEGVDVSIESLVDLFLNGAMERK